MSSTLQNVMQLVFLLLTLMSFTACVADDNEHQSSVDNSSDLRAALSEVEWGEVEHAIDSGLKWLSTQQNRDGSFESPANSQPGVTGFAVLAYLSRGHLPDRGPYGVQLSNAIDFILSTQKVDGSFSMLDWGPPQRAGLPAHTVSYNHPIAGLTLSEVYGMLPGDTTKRVSLVISKALKFSRKQQLSQKQHQEDRGGWRYPFPQPNEWQTAVGPIYSDLSVTSWELMFLRSARNAGFEVPKSHVDEGISFVERCYQRDRQQHRRGVFLYRLHDIRSATSSTFAMTGAGTLSMQLSGRHGDEKVQTAVEWMINEPFPRNSRTEYFFYSAFYCSLAMSQAGGDSWNHFFSDMSERVLAEQRANGSWFGSNRKEAKWGPVYCTSLAILSLTPVDQLLPIYQR